MHRGSVAAVGGQLVKALASGLVGLVVLAIGVLLAREGWTKEFLKRRDFGGAPAGTRSLVEKLGVLGGVARGAVTALAGVFVIIAAARFSPSKAEGIDGALRAFAHTPPLDQFSSSW